MTHDIYKVPVIFLIALLGSCYSASTQDFYKDYRNYLISRGHSDTKRITLIDTIIKRLRVTIGRFEKENKRPFFTSDTMFLVSFDALETNDRSVIVWNKSASCYYKHSYELNKPKMEIITNASDILKSFNHGFRYAIEQGDTIAYRIYAESHRVLDGEAVSPVIAIKRGKRWHFNSLLSKYAWAINYDWEPPKK